MFFNASDKFLLFLVCTLLYVDSYYVNGNEFSGDDKLVLSPAELVDMIWQEQTHGKSSSEQNQNSKCPVLKSIDAGDIAKEDAKSNARKVWSRWSKWSKCSVTCGGGQLIRRRVCVSGRCAPGEREEQHRACSLSPCAPTRFAAAYDVTASTDETREETK